MKKAQMQAMETILIAIILILILIFAIYFFSRLSDASLTEKRSEFRQDIARSTALHLASLPELSCPLEGGETRICIDRVKLDLMREALNNPSDPNGLYSDRLRLRYVELFGNTRITVSTHYPEEKEIVLFNATSAEFVTAQIIPINVYDPATDELSLGTVTVELE